MFEPSFVGLRNDHEPETFLLKHKTNFVVFPCQYIKIVPLMAWGANFNFSVWHVEVKGIPDTELVQETYFQYINVSNGLMATCFSKEQTGMDI